MDFHWNLRTEYTEPSILDYGKCVFFHSEVIQLLDRCFSLFKRSQESGADLDFSGFYFRKEKSIFSRIF